MSKTYLTLLLFFSFGLAFATSSEERVIVKPCADTVFLDIPAKDYPIAEGELPAYTTAVHLGKLTAAGDCEVSLDYPEYAPLKGDELRWAKKMEKFIADSIKVDSELGYSRKQGVLDLSFCPIVKRGNDFFRLTSCKINISVPTVTAKTKALAFNQTKNAQRWKTQSVLGEGQWAKLRVKQEGVYALTPSFLSKMGFKDISKVKVYGYGGRMLEEKWVFGQDGQVTDDLEEVPLYRQADGTALFFADGTVRWTYLPTSRKWIHTSNTYSDYSYYFVTEGENPAALPLLTTQERPSKTLDKVTHYAVYDKDAFGWYPGGREMYDSHDFGRDPSHTYKLNTPSPADGKGLLEIAFSASHRSKSTSVGVTQNGTGIGSFTVPNFGNYQSAYEVRRELKTGAIADENSLNLSIKPNNPARLNFIRINYTRQLTGTDAPYAFTPNTNGAVALQIAEANEHTQLWRIGSYGHPAGQIDATLENGTLHALLENGMERYVIVDVAAKYNLPEWDKKVENQNLHGDTTAYDMVILIPESRKWADEAERLAQAHRKMQGLRVKVVDAAQLYNEFSSGTPDATAYRRYMKMLYDRAQREEDIPRYLLLFGECSWDNRMLTEENKRYKTEDFLLSFEVTNGFNNPNNSSFPLGEQDSYVTDDYFGWLDDNEGGNYTRDKIDLGIGRLTCIEPRQAKAMVDKSISYLENKRTGAWKNTIYMLADNGNANLHMNDTESVIEQVEKSTHNNTIIKRVYNDAYSRVSTGTGHSFPTVTSLLQDAMKQGALIFNYTGHGSPDQLSHAKILRTPDFEVPNIGNMPLWIMASCEISPYDSRKNDLGRAALENPNGGAVAVMCASRSVYSNYNRILNTSYNKFLFGYDNNGRRNTMGDAMRLTKVDMVTPSLYGGIKDGSINKLKYLFLGDPALPLTSPTGHVIVDSINGKLLTPSDIFQLKAGSLVRFSGHIEDANKMELTDFNGTVTATLYDRLETIVCKNNDGSADDPMVYQEHTKKIFDGRDSVKNGRFSISCRIPKDISYTNDNGRVNFYAVNNEQTLECNGANGQYFLNGTDTSLAPDTLAPEVFIYLNTNDFPDGGITAPNPVFFANIKDDAGINATGSGIGHDMELVIDEDYSNPINLNDNFKYLFGSYRQGSVDYPLEGLEEGMHRLTFRVWDVNGNSTKKTLKFHIQNGMSNEFDVHATENPARTSTSFVTTFAAVPEEHNEAIFEVYDLQGQKVWNSQPVSIPANSGYGVVQWNLTNGGGARIPAGIYLYKVKLKNENTKRETKAKKIIVLEQ